MSEEAKRIGAGDLIVRSPSDDQKPSTAPEKKVIIKSADMKEDVQKEAVAIAIAAFEKFSVEKDVAEQIKKEFDKKYGPTWHCIVGKNFGFYLILEYSSVGDRKTKYSRFPLIYLFLWKRLWENGKANLEPGTQKAESMRIIGSAMPFSFPLEISIVTS
ncbi:Dynein light chain LC6, flagellar outer arm like [Actinidia chinensis var. chinensis]|uniref:Dynein light chain n=1 Tax=Actinidia chinensis var. chinensis TaxID=1590841 RepID=A0A2R6Q3Q8_ACTCC|nr:Dynein light chain LC6, flagellar outer arm like [Actinidia chinensis var. chinensis]